MKKLVLLLLCTVFLFSCTEEYDDKNVKNNLPQTEIFVQGQLLTMTPMTQKGVTYNWPMTTSEGWETARFSIRADGTIPDYTDKSSALYYGRFANGHNRGRVSNLYPYGHYNDRDLDYYKKDKKTGNNIGLFRYVYDPKGLKTQLAILEVPPVENILTDEIEDLDTEINKGHNVAKNTAEKTKVQALLAKGSDYLNHHVLWYVVKEVGMQYGWHVNGVFVDTVVQEYKINPDIVPDNIEVDIHQQKHTDWNEIKTSLHLRTDAESVTINIPLKYEDIIEQDDFAIRVYDFYYKEYTISHKITHDENGITIEISDIPASLISDLKSQFGDGLTVELHSYCKNVDIWDELSKSCVVKTGKPCTVNGQISSAYRDDVIPITIMKP